MTTDAAPGASDASPIDAADAIDSGVPDAPPADATARRCNPAGAFGAPVPLTTVNTGSNDEAARLSPDELTLYFSSNRPGGAGGFDIYVATRATLLDAFDNVAPVAVNATGTQRWPSVSGDGLYLYLLTQAADYDISFSQRASDTGPFGPLSLVGDINAAGTDDADPFLLPDHSAIYFSSTRGGNYDLYRAPRTGGSFGTPLPLVGDMLNTAGFEASPVVSPDELTILFSSDRAGGVGSSDMYMATRPSLADGFGAPVNLTALNTPHLDHPDWISADGCVLYYTSDVDPGMGIEYDLFVATRGP